MTLHVEDGSNSFFKPLESFQHALRPLQACRYLLYVIVHIRESVLSRHHPYLSDMYSFHCVFVQSVKLKIGQSVKFHSDPR